MLHHPFRQTRTRKSRAPHANPWGVLLGTLLVLLCAAAAHAATQPPAMYLRILTVNEAGTAEKVASLLAQGKSFAHLAAEYSIGCAKKQGGFLGRVVLEELQGPFRDMVRNLKVGDISGPVRVQERFVFFQRTTMTHYAEALRLMRSHAYGDALVPLDQDLALNPDRTHSLELKAFALEQLKRLPEAKATYREIMRQEPANVLAPNNLGVLLDQEGKHAEAVELFERVIAADPTQHLTLYNLAWLYVDGIPNASKALTFIQQAIAWKPDSPHYYAMLGTIYDKQGKLQQARAALAKAIELDPKNATYQDALARLGQSRRAAKQQKMAVPSSPPAHRTAVAQAVRVTTDTIKLVVHAGGAENSRRIARLLQHNGFPVALHIRDPKPRQGMRIFHKPHAIDTAKKIRDLIHPGLPLKRLTWKSQFDIIIYIGQ